VQHDPPATTEPPLDLQLHIWRVSLDPHRVIYSTILLMTAYAIYDEGTLPLDRRGYLALFGLSLGPLFALAMAHAFSDALDMQIRNGRRLTGHDRRHLLGSNLQYLYIAIPPMVIITLLGALEWDANDILVLVQVLGLLSLGWWGWFAGMKAGVGMGRRAWFAVSYTVTGAIVIAVELALTH